MGVVQPGAAVHLRLRDIRAKEVGAGQVGAQQDGLAEQAVDQVGVAQARAGEIGAHEVGVGGGHAAEVCLPQAAVRKVTGGNLRATQVGAIEHRATHAAHLEPHAAQAGAGKRYASRVGAAIERGVLHAMAARELHVHEADAQQVRAGEVGVRHRALHEHALIQARLVKAAILEGGHHRGPLLERRAAQVAAAQARLMQASQQPDAAGKAAIFAVGMVPEGFLDAAFGEVRLHALRAAQVRARHIGAAHTGARQVGACQHGVGEVAAVQPRVGEIGAGQDGALEVDAGKIHAAQVRASQVHVAAIAIAFQARFQLRTRAPCAQRRHGRGRRELMRRLLIGLMHLRTQGLAERGRHAWCIRRTALGLRVRVGIEVGDMPLHLAWVEAGGKLAVILQLAQCVHVDPRDRGHGGQVGIGQRARAGTARQAFGLFQLPLHAQDGLRQIGQVRRLWRRLQGNHVQIGIQALGEQRFALAGMPPCGAGMQVAVRRPLGRGFHGRLRQLAADVFRHELGIQQGMDRAELGIEALSHHSLVMRHVALLAGVFQRGHDVQDICRIVFAYR
jgi:hypothetical protein